ncbi:unnamed protein product [Dracunculus medinensis]|uniref:Uncharacterized protein n=1 Tax=Dracunculus medinensis TaxID=318479 RepID=A0A0N4U521_DRAME|nr:unnamed protein product [Dracunculus medinensis]
MLYLFHAIRLVDSNHVVQEARDLALINVLFDAISYRRRVFSKFEQQASKNCRPPLFVRGLPLNTQKKIINIWKSYDFNSKNCTLQRRKQRLVLLNQPRNLYNLLVPPRVPCGLPHFIERLTDYLQEEIRLIWLNYAPGEPCFRELDDELNLLQKNGIAIESFFIPPPNSLKRSDLYTKIFHPNLPS